MLNKSLKSLILVGIIASSSLFAEDENTQPGLNESTLKGLKWRGIGPALMSGRISDIEVDPRNRSRWYVAVGSGGVWKTENRGVTWTPLFDDESAYSIGDIAIDPSNPDTVWVGTGENVGGRHVGYGDGVYRSLNGGETWENLGLADTQHIGMIVVDPRDPNTVFVASQGPLWSGGGDRGLFKTTDGGQTWRNVLSDNEYTGVTEVHLDPRNPDVMYAAAHQRLRTVAALMNSGPGSAIHKSTDGGETWRKLEEGLPKGNMGKIALAVSPVNPDTVYASIEGAQRNVAFYRSRNGGESWEKQSEYESNSTGPHYYVELWASPHDEDEVWEADNRIRFTDDGGSNHRQLSHATRHVDHHALAFDPNNRDYILLGTDGGLYESWDRGVSWRFIDNLPVTQFYKVAVDYDTPFYNLYGGTQDNNTQGGPSRTVNAHGIVNSDWFITTIWDGHQPAADPTNPDILYGEMQQGALFRYDRKNGEIVFIQPQPDAGENSERFNWDAPILISPHDPARLYFASQRLWRSDDRGDSWTPISGDLSHGKNRLLEPMMGMVWGWDNAWDLSAMSRFGTITSISESPLEDGLLYVGTDDGRIQISEDGGSNWRAIDALPGVPEGFFVNDIKADLHDPDTAYVVVDNHKNGDFMPYVLKTTNRGRLWTSISSNLPDRHVTWRLVQDHVKPGLLFVGTEFGVFFTVDGGDHWTKLSGGAPTIPFRDLAIQKRENDLVGATFGRGFYILDDYSALRDLTTEQLQAEASLFPVRDAHWYIPRRPLGESEAGSQAAMGDGFYVAPNPPFGAVFTYYLAEGYSSKAQARQKADKKANDAGEDAPFPGFEAMQVEAMEDEPAVIFTIRDADQQIIRRFSAPAKKGFHRVAWDLRRALTVAWAPEAPSGFMGEPGPLVAPGQYTVSMANRIDAVETPLAENIPFNVVSIREAALDGAAPDAMAAHAERVHHLRGQVSAAGEALSAALEETGAIKSTLLRSQASPGTHSAVHDLEIRLKQLEIRLSGDPHRDNLNESGPVSIGERLYAAQFGVVWSAYGPTPNLLRSLNIAESEFAEVSADLRKILTVELPELRTQLDGANVPWTPGRGAAAGD